MYGDKSGPLVSLLDALARGASPPGMVGAVHLPNSHLRRRFTMIARFDGKRTNGWSVAGIAASLLLGAVAFTGGVRGQAAAPSSAPAGADDGGAAVQAAAKNPGTPPAPATPGGITEAEAEKLWAEKYADKIYTVQGKEANRAQVDQEYLAELDALGGVRKEPAPAPATEPQVPVEDEDVDQAILAQLERPIPELNFDGAALADVVDFLRDVSGANLVVEWRSLEAAGVDRNAPVSIRLKNIRFGQAMELVLSNVGGGQVPLGYTIDRNVIRVSTGEDLDRVSDIRAYDVRDIVPAEMPMQDLTKMISEAVAPDSWRDSGGSVGSIHTSKHKLIVKQTPMNHRELRDVLRMLRDDPTRVPRATDAASAAQATPAAVQPRAK